MNQKEKYLAEYITKYKKDRDKQVRKFGEFAGWDVISRCLTIDDIDFIREYRQYIYWDLVPKELLENKDFIREFEKELIYDK